ncbi:MAG TPA: hypothetical protein VG320_00105 [Paraburkholderia sp.]|uniref:hypothetical protein n=1 Tax=Paraburkholderia sp. TaxID=1926495 RepID=UPI002DE9BA48|nr:hypothetical protein [Paraburkholderia sp.]
MDWGTVAQLVVIASSLFGFRKLYLDTSLASRSRKREEYKFAKEFLAELQGDKKVHQFLREKGCEALTGSRNANPDHVEYLLSLGQPSQALREYSESRSYLEYSDIKETQGHFRFKGWYRKKWVRNTLKTWYIGLYAAPVFSLLWLPKLADAVFSDKRHRAIFALVYYVVALSVGYFFLVLGRRIVNAESLVARAAIGVPEKETETSPA